MAEKNESAKSTRQKAAEAREAAAAAERRRERTIRIVGGLAVLVVVLGILAVGVMQSKKDKPSSADANSPLPNGISASNEYGWQVNDAPGKPNVELYEDFQCPGCKNLETTYGKMIQKEAAAGNIQLTYRPMVFLDTNLKNDSSIRAASALGCAINAGVGEKFHNIVYANQPQQEGQGYTNDQLKQFGAEAGLTGQAQTDFDACVDAGTYQGWAQLSNDAAFNRGVTGTPTIYVNGKELPSNATDSEQAFKDALTNPSQ